MTAAAPPHYFIYDSRCGLCVGFRDWLMERARPGEFEPVAFGDPKIAALLPGRRAEEIRESAHVITPAGRVLSGHAAIRIAVRVSWWGRLIHPLLSLRFLDPLQRVTYTWIAKNRHRLSCRMRDAQSAQHKDS